MNFICFACELFMSLMSTSLVLHGYNISTSLVIRCEVHMNFIRTACKFIWINLISFHMKFMRSSFELHTKVIWTSREFHMNKFDFISYEIRKKFIWTLYEARMKLTTIFLCSSNKFHVKLWINGFIWTSYEWASRSIVGPTWIISDNGPLIIYVKLRVAHGPGMPGTLSPPPTLKEIAS